jgi:hypothetical protein
MYFPSSISVVPIHLYSFLFVLQFSHRAGSAEFDSRTDVTLPTDEYLDLKVPALEAGGCSRELLPLKRESVLPPPPPHTHTQAFKV